MSNAYERCQEKKIHIDLSILMVNKLHSLTYLYYILQRGLLAPHEVEDMMVRANQLKVLDLYLIFMIL